MLTGDNSYTGGTTIADGTLQLGDGGLSGSITGDVLNNSVLAVDRSDTLSLLGNITGTGSLVKSGAGQLILGGSNHYSGGDNHPRRQHHRRRRFRAVGEFGLQGQSRRRPVVRNGVEAAIGSLADGPLGGGNVVIGLVDPNTYLTIGVDDSSTSFSGIITGAGSLEKTGTGIQTLTGVGSAIGGDLILCDCGGSGGLVIAGGTFDAGGEVDVFDSALSVTLGGVLRQLDPNQGILIESSSMRSRARDRSRRQRRRPDVRQRCFRHGGRRLQPARPQPGNRHRRKHRAHRGRRDRRSWPAVGSSCSTATSR